MNNYIRPPENTTVKRIKCRRCGLNTAEYQIIVSRYMGEETAQPFCPRCDSTAVLGLVEQEPEPAE